MKRAFLICLLILLWGIAGAQNNDNTIYNGCTDSKRPSIDSIYKRADNCPAFIGGFSAFMSYMGHNIHLPKKIDDLPGKMLISVIIEKDGSLSNPIIIAGRNKKINKEILRVFRKSPKWQPASFKGKPVRCCYEISLAIDLSQS